MVYETDFYTTRRPYSRPTISSYSVTVPPYYHHHAIPFVAHTRITSTAPPPRSIRVRPSVLVAEIDRIAHKSRPQLSYQPTEDFLNSMSGFDDETRAIRAHTNALLKRVHEPLPPRSRKPILTYTSSYDVDPPARITSDAYIQRMLGQNRSVQNEVEAISYYPEPAKQFIGKGHLACLSFAGGRPISKRRNLAWRRDEDRHIKDEVNFLSHYGRMRTAAMGPNVPEGYNNEAPGGLYYLSHSLNRYSARNGGNNLTAEYVPSKSVVDDRHFSSKVARAEMKEEREKAKLRTPKVDVKEGRSAKEEEEEKRRLEEEEERARKMEERRKEAERKELERIKEEEERQKREAEKKRQEEEAERKRLEEEEAERKRKEEEAERKRKEEEAERKRKEEAEKKRLEEEAEKKRLEEEEAERKRQEEEAEKKRLEEEAEKKRLEEEAEKKRLEEEEAERKRQEEEAEKKRLEEEEAEKKRLEEEEAERKRQEEEERKNAEEQAEAVETEAVVEEKEEEAKVVETEEAEKVEDKAEENVEDVAEPLVEEPTSPEEAVAEEGGTTIEEVPATPEEETVQKIEEATPEMSAEETNEVEE